MAKICKQCGVKHNGNAKTCGICGAPFEDVRVTIIRKTLIIYAIVAFLVASLVVTLIVVTSGPRGTVRKILGYYSQNDPVSIVNTYPSFALETEDWDMDKLVFSISRSVEYMSEYLVYCSTSKPESPNERDRNQLVEYFCTGFADTIDEDKLEDIQYVWVKLEGQSGGVWSRAITRFTMIKYDGEWYWWPDNFNYYGKPM